jgi:hypothetical protein
MNAFLTEVTQAKGFTGALARAATRGRQKDGVVDFGPSDAQLEVVGASASEAKPVDSDTMAASAGKAEGEAPAELVVVAGGNLALIYFTAKKTRLTLEEIAELYPDLVEALANHPGIGVLMVRSADHGLICVGKQGINYLDEERVEGEDPLAVYGEYAGAAFRRLDAIAHVGDVAVVSHFDPETEEIAAFEELIGAHGGLGGAQTRPFMLYPADWELDLAPLVGAPMVYQQLRRWMEQHHGFTFGPQGTANASASTAAAVAGPATEGAA